MRFNFTYAMLVLGALIVADRSARANSADPDRQNVSARGVQVMPFSLNATTHVFTKTTNGVYNKS